MNNLNCCPPINVSSWNGTVHKWKHKLFFHDEVFQVSEKPVRMAKAVHTIFKKAEKKNYTPKEFLIKSSNASPFQSAIYKQVKKALNDEQDAHPSGTYVSKVFEGPYNYVSQFKKEMGEYLASQKKRSEKYYFHYAFCPNCTKKYRHNYCIGMAKVN